MKRDSRQSNRERVRKLKRRMLLDFDRLEVRQLLSMTYTVNNTNATGRVRSLTRSPSWTGDVDPGHPNVIQFNIPGGG